MTGLPAGRGEPGIASRIGGLHGWRRYGLALVFGAVCAAGLPPAYVVPALAIGFTGLVWQIDHAPSGRVAFALGWCFGFGYFVAGLYWIAFALLTDPERYGWMVPFAVGGSSAYLALFPAIATWLARALRPAGPGRVLVLAATWTAGEWVRGLLLTGFPWNPIGNVWAFSPSMMQLAAVTGVFGLSLVTVAVAAAPATFFDGRRAGWTAVVVAALGLAAMWGGGAARIAAGSEGHVPGVLLRVVQPNIAQNHKWRQDLRVAQFAKYLKLSAREADRPPTHIIWPETAAPFFLAKDDGARRAIATIVPPGGLLVTGTLRTTKERQRPFKVWNSLQVVDGTGSVAGTYDKFHLVPFGEYVPLRSILGIAKITPGNTDFSAGRGPRTLRLNGLPPVSPLICYEAIFPGAVTDDGDRPAWLLNVTNDAWFGISSGPYQHFASARMRAVEEGLPLVRAANTGISAFIDPYGRVTARLGLGEEGVIDAPLPRARPKTVFARWGDGGVAASVVLALVAGLTRRRPKV